MLSWLLMALLLAMVYRLLPDVEIGWRDVAWGSAITSLLFTIGKYAIGFYLQRTGVTTTYGAAGSLVLLLLWIYLSSLIFLLGAEFTRVHSRRYRDGRAPATPGAVRVETIQVPLETASLSSAPAAVFEGTMNAKSPPARVLALGVCLASSPPPSTPTRSRWRSTASGGSSSRTSSRPSAWSARTTAN